MVLNSTNAKIIKSFCSLSPFVEDWNNVTIQLYIDNNVKMMGDTVSGVRIKTIQPRLEKTPVTQQNTKLWNSVINAYKKYSNFDKVLEKHTITEENKKIIEDFCNDV